VVNAGAHYARTVVSRIYRQLSAHTQLTNSSQLPQALRALDLAAGFDTRGEELCLLWTVHCLRRGCTMEETAADACSAIMSNTGRGEFPVRNSYQVRRLTGRTGRCRMRKRGHEQGKDTGVKVIEN
jgi:hypothetical protein